jgi:GxxExxY protein
MGSVRIETSRPPAKNSEDWDLPAQICTGVFFDGSWGSNAPSRWLPLSAMHRNFPKADILSHAVIGGAIEVHGRLGPGLLEEIYKRCLIRELELRGLAFSSELAVPAIYKGMLVHSALRLDVCVDGRLIIEAKAVQTLQPIHQAQLLGYMRLLDTPVGILINFNEIILKSGIRRLTLRGGSRP